MQKQQSSPPAGRAPWWKFGHVWLVLAGPAAVAVGCVVTTWIALSNPDPVVAADYYKRGIEINKVLGKDRAQLPAVQGRNHAVTPAAP